MHEYHQLNKVTINNKSTLPRINDLFDQRGENVPKMIVRTRYGHYEFIVMSFCLTNTLESFMDLMNEVFRKCLDAFVTVVINDILVYSKNEGDHMGHLRVVFHTIMEDQLYAKYSKREFCLRSVTFLGHIISSEGVEVHPRKTEAMKNVLNL